MEPRAQIVISVLPDGQVQCGFKGVDRISCLGLLEIAKRTLDEAFLKQAEGKLVIPAPSFVPSRP